MSRARYDAGGSDEIVKWFRGVVADIDEVSREELETTAQEGEEFVRGLIMTRGTNKKWARPHGGKTGGGPARVDSGNMLHSVSSNVTSQGPGKGRAFFGWLGGFQSGDNDYFMYQEGGFTHNYTGEEVEGMYAIVDAAEAAFENLKRRLSSALKSAGRFR